MDICRTDCRGQVFEEERPRGNVLVRKKMRVCKTLDTGHWTLVLVELDSGSVGGKQEE